MVINLIAVRSHFSVKFRGLVSLICGRYLKSKKDFGTWEGGSRETKQPNNGRGAFDVRTDLLLLMWANTSLAALAAFLTIGVGVQ